MSSALPSHRIHNRDPTPSLALQNTIDMHTVFTVRPTHPPTPPVNKHSGPEDTIYVNHSGASIKRQVSTPLLEPHPERKVDPVVSLITRPVQEKLRPTSTFRETRQVSLILLTAQIPGSRW